MTGKISLVGAGPGDPGLLTLNALRALQSADAVVYDRLVSDGVLALIPPCAERIFAGKSCKGKAMTQEEINALLIALARDGKHAVRLKGGDPLLFGRGGEEALALAEAGVTFEIVPGVTSATACAAYAGIPLTHRGLATGVRFVTGHRTTADDASEPLALDWPGLADPDTTLVIYMGLANLAFIAEKLIAHGLPPDTPAAAIASGTTAAQRVLRSTLENLPRESAAAQLAPPTLAIIGKVASLTERLRWFNPQTIENASVWTEIVTKMSY